MSDASRAARLTIIVADFANVDSAGKVNVIGGNVGLIGFDPMQGVTNRFAVWAHATFPDHLLPAEISVELALMNGKEVVSVPNGPLEPQAVRVAQSTIVEKSMAPVASNLRDHVGANTNFVLDFQNGLPLQPNGTYDFRLQIDGDEENEIRYAIAVVGPPPGAVIG